MFMTVLLALTVLKILSIRFIVLSCGVYVDEIHDGMLALLSQVRYVNQVLYPSNGVQAHYC
jgi:hypothetical protein